MTQAAPGCFRRDRRCEAVLARSLDEHCVAEADAAVAAGELDAVAHGDERGRERCGHVGRHLMDHRVGMDVDVLGVAAPERRPHRQRRRAVPEASLGAGLGARTVAEQLRAAPLAGAARHVLLDGDAIAFPDAPSLRRRLADPGNDSDVFVAHDLRVVRGAIADARVAAADAAGLDAQQATVVRQRRDVDLAQLELVRAGEDCCLRGLRHRSWPSAAPGPSWPPGQS